MNKKTLRRINKIIIPVTFITSIIFALLVLFAYLNSTRNISSSDSNQKNTENRLFHIVVTGTYENKLFLEEVYKGALSYADQYNCIIELYVPKSQAEAVSLEELLNYCSFVNADGVIAFIDNTDSDISVIPKIDGNSIPLVTTGYFSPNLHQISFIGNGYWELGKKIADETFRYFDKPGEVYIICEPSSANDNYSNLLTSLQNSLYANKELNINLLEKIDASFVFPENNDHNSVFICLTDEDIIQTAQTLSDLYSDRNYNIIGFGNNETSQLYLDKGQVSELISIDPVKIGEKAVKELFEYRRTGYANSYIAADVKFNRYKK